ncbi:MAG: VacJ family lipoprotein [Desulfobacterales bacterium]
MNRTAFFLCAALAVSMFAISCFPDRAFCADAEDPYADILNDLEEDEQTPGKVSDPLYYWNKGMFHVNDKLWFWVMKPVASGYKTVTPEPVRNGIRNFFGNLFTPVRFVNCILQGKTERAGVELGRFMVNTVVGVGGFGNPADKEPALKRVPEEDFGQTLAVYGVGSGFYIVWPVMGPSSLRDTAGKAGDSWLSPLSYVDTGAAMGLRAVDTVNGISFRIGDYEALKNAAVDPYEAFRDAYIQNREKKVRE